MAESQWERVARPILEQVLLWEDDDNPLDEGPTSEQVAAALDVPLRAVMRQLDDLQAEGYVDFYDTRAGGGAQNHVIGVRLLARGRRQLGEWPGEPGEEFIKRLDRLIALADDPEEQKRLSALKMALRAVGTATISGLVEASAQGLL